MRARAAHRASARERQLEPMVALLYMESHLHDPDLCTGTDCDNRGHERAALHAPAASRAEARPCAGNARSPRTVGARPLEPVVADRPRCRARRLRSRSVGAYRTACAAIHEKLLKAFDGFYEPCQSCCAKWRRRIRRRNGSTSAREAPRRLHRQPARHPVLLRLPQGRGRDLQRVPRRAARRRHRLLPGRGRVSQAPGARRARPEAARRTSARCSTRRRRPARPTSIAARAFLVRKLDAHDRDLLRCRAAGRHPHHAERVRAAALEERAIPFYYAQRGPTCRCIWRGATRARRGHGALHLFVPRARLQRARRRGQSGRGADRRVRLLPHRGPPRLGRAQGGEGAARPDPRAATCRSTSRPCSPARAPARGVRPAVAPPRAASPAPPVRATSPPASTTPPSSPRTSPGRRRDDSTRSRTTTLVPTSRPKARRPTRARRSRSRRRRRAPRCSLPATNSRARSRTMVKATRRRAIYSQNSAW